MAAFELGDYFRVSLENWNRYFQDVVDPSDFFEYEGYYYIRYDDYDDEELVILDNGLEDYLDRYVYFSSSVHFGE